MTQSPERSEPLSPTKVIAQRVRELRQKRGKWSAERLAEEMTKVGIPWDRSIVANLENGRRQTVAVEELLALAYVLDVAPVHLLVPVEDDDLDQGPFLWITPKLGVPPSAARAWVRGRQQAPGQDPRPFFADVPASEWDKQEATAADIAGESARIQYHRREHGGVIDGDYWRGAHEAEQAARQAAERSHGDG